MKILDILSIDNVKKIFLQPNPRPFNGSSFFSTITTTGTLSMRKALPKYFRDTIIDLLFRKYQSSIKITSNNLMEAVNASVTLTPSIYGFSTFFQDILYILSRTNLSITDISHVLYALRLRTFDAVEVQNILHIILLKLRHFNPNNIDKRCHTNLFSIHELAISLYGLRHMKKYSKSVSVISNIVMCE